MTKRTDMKHVKSTFTNTQPHKVSFCSLGSLSHLQIIDCKLFSYDLRNFALQREVCQLIPATVSDRKGVINF